MANACCSNFNTTTPWTDCANICVANSSAGFTGVGTDGSVWFFLGGNPCLQANWTQFQLCCSILTYAPLGDSFTHNDGQGNVTVVDLCCPTLTDNFDGTYTHDDGRGNIVVIDSNTVFDPSITGCLTATTMQGAIDELSQKERAFQVVGLAADAVNCDPVTDADTIFHTGDTVIGAVAPNNGATFTVEGTTALGANDHAPNMGANSSILGGTTNSVTAINSVGWGDSNSVTGGANSSALGGTDNVISASGTNNSITGGSTNSITGAASVSEINTSIDSTISAVTRNSITVSARSAITGAAAAGNIENSADVRITGGFFNSIIGSIGATTIISGGNRNAISNSSDIQITGGQSNSINNSTGASITSTGAHNTVEGSENSNITGVGSYNAITGSNIVDINGGSSQLVSNSFDALIDILADTQNTIIGCTGDGAGNRISILSGAGSTILGSQAGAFGPIVITAPGGHSSIFNAQQGVTISSDNSMSLRGGTSVDTTPTILAGRNTFAVGYGVSSTAANFSSFIFNASELTGLASVANSSISMKGPGGTRIFSNDAQTTGVTLAAGGNAWVAVSDRSTKKEIAKTPSLLDRFNKVDVFTYKVIDNFKYDSVSIQGELEELERESKNLKSKHSRDEHKARKAALLETVKSEHDRTFIGVMADDINDQFSDIFTPYEVETLTGTKQAISDNSLINILWGVVRELSAKVEVLESKNKK